MSSDSVASGGLTLDRALAEAAQELGGAGIHEARHEARLLAAHVLGVTPDAILREPQSPFHREQAAGFKNCVAPYRRLSGAGNSGAFLSASLRKPLIPAPIPKL